MSDTILNHGYMPEEHAPDPVMNHGDPTPPGKVGIWLFLASEVMFFTGILATYIIFRAGSPKIFAEHAQVLSKTLGGINTLVLIFSSLTMALGVDAAQKGLLNRLRICLALTLLCAAGFITIKMVEYHDKLWHHTVVAKDAADGKLYVYDGHEIARTPAGFTLRGPRILMPTDGPFDIHWMSPKGVESVAESQIAAHLLPESAAPKNGPEPTWIIKNSTISQDITYGPWKNIFFASYFVTTGVHGVHVLGGMVALVILLGQAMRKKVLPAHTEYVGLYWHFVDVVWIFLFPLLYLI